MGEIRTVNDNVVSSYGYDENGNRTSVELNWSQLGYSAEFDASLDETETDYNQADQLLTYGTKSYTWNNFGQLESMHDSATNETTHYEYDLFGNLLSVALPDGRTIEYDVDGAGRRIGRRELDANGNEISFRGWIYRDLLRPIAEVNALGEVVARYVYSDGDGARQNGVKQLATRLGANQDTSLPFSGNNVPEAIELLDSAGSVTQTLMLSTNQVGSVQLVTDAATGEVVQRIAYDEFGRVLSDSAPGSQPFGFAGGLYDAETNLVRFGARDYASDVGRWIARDPVRFSGSTLNHFEYAKGSPIMHTDEGGYTPFDRWPHWVKKLGPKFKRWFHRNYKKKGDRDMGDDAVDEWERCGQPDADNNRGGKRNRDASDDDWDPWGELSDAWEDIVDGFLPPVLPFDPCDLGPNPLCDSAA